MKFSVRKAILYENLSTINFSIKDNQRKIFLLENYLLPTFSIRNVINVKLFVIKNALAMNFSLRKFTNVELFIRKVIRHESFYKKGHTR